MTGCARPKPDIKLSVHSHNTWFSSAKRNPTPPADSYPIAEVPCWLCQTG
jgi:hypothetical protein